jgi:hypothetical protein
MPRKKKQAARGAAVFQKEAGLINEMLVLDQIDLMGWLTSYQIQELVCVSEYGGNNVARKIIARLQKKRLVHSVNLSGGERKIPYKKKRTGFALIDSKTKKTERKSGHHINAPKTKARAYVLSEKGVVFLKKHLKKNNFVRANQIKKTATFLDDINDNKYQFHRCVGNQFLIDCKNGEFYLTELANFEMDLFLSESELLADCENVDKHFDHLPDAIIKDMEQNILFCVEVENSKRGDFNHGRKLSGWLFNYLQEVGSEGCYLRNHKNGQAEPPFKKKSYRSHSDVFQIFICSNEEIFRSIYRQVNILMKQLNYSKEVGDRLQDRVFYFILHETKAWANPITRKGVEFKYEVENESDDYINEPHRFYEHFENEAKEIAYRYKSEEKHWDEFLAKEAKKDHDYSDPKASLFNRVNMHLIPKKK